MALSAETIAALREELETKLSGGRIDKIHVNIIFAPIRPREHARHKVIVKRTMLHLPQKQVQQKKQDVQAKCYKKRTFTNHIQNITLF